MSKSRSSLGCSCPSQLKAATPVVPPPPACTQPSSTLNLEPGTLQPGTLAADDEPHKMSVIGELLTLRVSYTTCYADAVKWLVSEGHKAVQPEEGVQQQEQKQEEKQTVRQGDGRGRGGAGSSAPAPASRRGAGTTFEGGGGGGAGAAAKPGLAGPPMAGLAVASAMAGEIRQRILAQAHESFK